MLATHPMKLVTIICEALARSVIKRLISEVGARGYTMFAVEGAGAKGERSAEMTEFGNIQVEVIVPPPVCDHLMERLEKELFPTYTMIAYVSDIVVRRSAKF